MAHQCLNAVKDENEAPADDKNNIDSSGSDDSTAALAAHRLNFPSSSLRPVPQARNTKNDNIFAVAKDIKDGMVEMSDRLASALINGQQGPAFNNDLQEIKALLKAQAEQNVETNQLLRSFIQAAMQKQ